MIYAVSLGQQKFYSLNRVRLIIFKAMKIKILQQRINRSPHWAYIKFFLTVIAVYVILFEFILNTVSVFPRPSLIWESVLYLSDKFSIFSSLGILWALIFGGLIISFFITYIFRVPLITFFDKFPDVFIPFKIFLFFTPLVLILFWNIYFKDNWLTESLLIVLVSLSIIFYEMAIALKGRKTSYELAAKGLGKLQNEIYSKVTWKQILPDLKAKISPLHIKLWSYVLISQFISGSSIGGLFRELFEYRDFAGIYALAILVWIIVWLNEMFWYYVSEKIIFWES